MAVDPDRDGTYSRPMRDDEGTKRSLQNHQILVFMFVVVFVKIHSLKIFHRLSQRLNIF